MMTVAQAAKALGISRQRVHILMKDNRILAKRYGEIWMVKDAVILPIEEGKAYKEKLRQHKVAK